MSIMSSIVNWIVNTGIKLITSFIRTAVQISGVPNARLPTERDVICEVGGTLIKSVLKAKAKQKVTNFMSTFVKPALSIFQVQKGTSDQQMLVIDI